MIVLSLFDMPDFGATANRVNRFLSVQLPRLALRSGRHLADLSSPQLSLAPGSGSHGNNAENIIVNSMEADAVINAISYCIMSMPGTSKQILTKKYLDQLSDWKVQQKMGYSERQYFRLKRQALNDFADGYDSAQVRFCISEDNLIDLHSEQPA